MNRFSFIEGLGIALAASIGGGIVFFSLAPWFTAAFVFRLIVTAIGFIYASYLLAKAGRRTGRVTALTVWVLLAASGWLFIHSLLLFIALHLTMIWLIRSLYFYNRLAAALVDLFLCAMSLGAAAWAAHHTGSVALGIWCLFLVQALTAMIPAEFRRSRHARSERPAESDPFERAYRTAEWALRKLS